MECNSTYAVFISLSVCVFVRGFPRPGVAAIAVYFRYRWIFSPYVPSVSVQASVMMNRKFEMVTVCRERVQDCVLFLLKDRQSEKLQ